jgi:uncharacterized membrane protein YGL010W
MLRSFIRNNITLVSIIIFVIIFTIVQMLKPPFLYNKDGSICLNVASQMKVGEKSI